MTSLQSKFLFIGGLLLMVKISFLLLIFIIAKKIEKRTKQLKARKKTNPKAKPYAAPPASRQ